MTARPRPEPRPSAWITEALRTEELAPDVPPLAPQPLDDPELLRAHLQSAAAARQPLTYSDLLARLGHRFTRPKMRTLCRALGTVDATRPANTPELAVLVVRATDRLPGAGWWTDRPTPASPTAAAALIQTLQAAAFRHWQPAAPTQKSKARGAAPGPRQERAPGPSKPRPKPPEN